jgi:hypothetical protein
MINEYGCLRPSGGNSGRHCYLCVCLRARDFERGGKRFFPMLFSYNFILRMCWSGHLTVGCRKASGLRADKSKSTHLKQSQSSVQRSFRREHSQCEVQELPDGV